MRCGDDKYLIGDCDNELTTIDQKEDHSSGSKNKVSAISEPLEGVSAIRTGKIYESDDDIDLFGSSDSDK
jgi:hypothetical protein